MGAVDLVLVKTSLLLLFKFKVFLMLTSWQLNEKGGEVCIKAGSSPASLAFIGLVTKHTTVKWPFVKWPVAGDEYINIHRANVINTVLLCISQVPFRGECLHHRASAKSA